MSRTIIDASVAIKWVVEEDGAPEALVLLEAGFLSAPDLLIPECINILWKKVRRFEFEKDEAIMAARLLQKSDVEILPTRVLMEEALKLSVALDHAAYDCIYLSLALEKDWRFVTADKRLRRKVYQLNDHDLMTRLCYFQTPWIKNNLNSQLKRHRRRTTFRCGKARCWARAPHLSCCAQSQHPENESNVFDLAG